jgi:type III secretion system FlhB-like substrate exporter
MKIRLVSQKQVKKAYTRKSLPSAMDLKENLTMDNLDKLPKELFQILGETLSFIEYVNNKEGDLHEDK